MSSMETLRVKAPGSSSYPNLRVAPSKRSTSKLALITPLNIAISLKNRHPCLPGLLRGLRETVVVQHFGEAAVKYTLPVLRNHWILENSLMFTHKHPSQFSDVSSSAEGNYRTVLKNILVDVGSKFSSEASFRQVI